MSNLAHDYVRDEYRRQEMIGGKLYMMAGSVKSHIRATGNIFFEFNKYLRGKSCNAYGDGRVVYFSETDYVVPDVTVVCDKNKDKDKGIYGAPDLIVEVLSPSTQKRDLGDKMRLYEKHGVREYWIVDARGKTVSIYLPVNGSYELAEFYAVHPDYELEDMTDEEKAAVVTEFSPSIFPDMKVTLDDVFYGLIE